MAKFCVPALLPPENASTPDLTMNPVALSRSTMGTSKNNIKRRKPIGARNMVATPFLIINSILSIIRKCVDFTKF